MKKVHSWIFIIACLLLPVKFLSQKLIAAEAGPAWDDDDSILFAQPAMPLLSDELPESHMSLRPVSEYADTHLRPASEMIPPGTNIQVLVLGETGAGKSTFINVLTNYFLNIEGRMDPGSLKVAIGSRYMQSNVKGFLSTESDVTNTRQSQTTQCTDYPFVVGSRSKTGQITFIDTPGFGDTRGLKQDEANLNGILENASQQRHLSSIILVVNGTVARETATTAYANTLRQGAIPDVLARNLILVFTHCLQHECNTRPADLGFGDLNPEQVFYMNNSLFSTDPMTWDAGIREDFKPILWIP